MVIILEPQVLLHLRLSRGLVLTTTANNSGPPSIPPPPAPVLPVKPPIPSDKQTPMAVATAIDKNENERDDKETSATDARSSFSSSAFIEVHMRTINIGDIKFEEDPLHASLNGIMSGTEYETAIGKINVALKPCRSTPLDHALLAMGPAMIPLIPWAYRQQQHKSLRREIMERCVNQFNSEHSDLHMRWERRP